MYIKKKEEILKSVIEIRKECRYFVFPFQDEQGNKIIKVKQQINYDQRDGC